jgi:hypothetical protein
VKEPEVPASPLVEAGTIAEPADLPSLPKAIAEIMPGARVADEPWKRDEREALIYRSASTP